MINYAKPNISDKMVLRVSVKYKVRDLPSSTVLIVIYTIVREVDINERIKHSDLKMLTIILMIWSVHVVKFEVKYKKLSDIKLRNDKYHFIISASWTGRGIRAFKGFRIQVNAKERP